MPSDYLCNLIIPGAAKSGTSSLHEYLGKHPEISMSSNKEPHHFCRDERYIQGAKKHNELFEQTRGVRYFGESSTGYLPWVLAAERVARDLENPKVIMLLRHPVDRCFSHYRWRYWLGLEKRSFLQALKTDAFGFHPERPKQFGYMAYLEFSQYERQCAIWENAVGAENCLMISSNQLLMNRSCVLTRCFDFLGLPQIASSDASEKFNETASMGRRSPEWATKVMKLVPQGLKSSQTYQGVRNLVLKSVAPTPPLAMTKEELAFIQDALTDDISWFEARFGQSNSALPEFRKIK